MYRAEDILPHTYFPAKLRQLKSLVGDRSSNQSFTSLVQLSLFNFAQGFSILRNIEIGEEFATLLGLERTSNTVGMQGKLCVIKML